MRYWHDLTPGQSFETASITLTSQAISEFAEQFDPQPYHLDSDAAKASIFGDLCASGWQVCVLTMRLLTDAFEESEIALMGIQDTPSLSWKIPVFVQDSLTAFIVITQCQAGSSLAGQGCISCDINVRNQKQQTVMMLNCTLLVAHAQGNAAVAAP